MRARRGKDTGEGHAGWSAVAGRVREGNAGAMREAAAREKGRARQRECQAGARNAKGSARPRQATGRADSNRDLQTCPKMVSTSS